MKRLPSDACYWWARDMREADLEELLYAGATPFLSPAEMLVESLVPGDPLVGIVDKEGKLQGMFGWGPWNPGSTDPEMPEGYIWMVTTEKLFEEYPVEMTRRFRREILPRLLGEEAYRSLGNLVLYKNTEHLKWLTAAGFRCRGKILIRCIPFLLMTIEA